ncbi:MAG: glycosyltransferase, partial [Candidatus Magasanikbacteria bacterium]|nr:glycosyltransferase [Candidatus Magasanikbacteria bacterium]
FFHARAILKEVQPDIVVTAGGFVSVPVHVAAWTMKIPSLVHQQDIEIGLANKLMSWIARRVTVSVEAQLTKFSAKKVVLTGNPIRASVLGGSREKGMEIFRLNPELATIFIFGGGTGADAINRAVEQLVQECSGQFQIIHLTGTDRKQSLISSPTYHPYPFFMGEMAHAYAVADIIVSRAGFNSITEISAWGKPSILIPIHGSHQLANANFAAAAGAAIVIDEFSLGAENLFHAIRGLLTDDGTYHAMSEKSSSLLPHDATRSFVDVLIQTVHN